MDNRSRRGFDIYALGIALGVIVVTVTLTFLSEVLMHCRGSSLMYLGWLLLAGSAIGGSLILGRSRSHTLAIFRNISLFLGLVLIGFAIALNAYAEGMFKW